MDNPHPSGRTPVAVAWAVSAVALGLAATAAAVDIRGAFRPEGTLTNPANAVAGAPTKPYWEEWNGFLEAREREPEPSRVLAAVLVGEGSGPPTGCEYALRGGDFDPTTLVAQKGTTLRIENTDGCVHELYSDDIEGFSPLQTAPGNARTVTLPETGQFIIRDRLYPHVVGHLHVLDRVVACARITKRGRFEFTDVPEGTYTLKVFYGEKEVASQEVEASGRRTAIEPIIFPAREN